MEGTKNDNKQLSPNRKQRDGEHRTSIIPYLMEAFYLRVSFNCSLRLRTLNKTLDTDVHLISRFLEKKCHHKTRKGSASALNLESLEGADAQTGLITYTNPPK